MILHITSKADWAAAQTAECYVAPSLQDEGFIHGSTAAQIVATANRFYPGREDLMLLVIDPRRLSAAVRYENTMGGTELFPHVYGPIELAAVVDARPWGPVRGVFLSPEWLAPPP